MNGTTKRVSTGIVCVLAGLIGVSAARAGTQPVPSKAVEEMASLRAMIAELTGKLASVEEAIEDVEADISAQRAYIARILQGGDKGSPREFRHVVRQAQAHLRELMSVRDGLVAEAKDIQQQIDELSAQLARLAASVAGPTPAVFE